MIQNERKLLASYLKHANQKGQNVQLRYNKLVIDGKVYIAHDLKAKSTSLNVEGERTMKRPIDERSPQGFSLTELVRK